MLNKIKRHLARFDLLAKYPMEEYGYSKAWLFWDYAWAWVFHRCTLMDYFLYHFYHLSWRGRREYVCLWAARDYHRMNPKSVFEALEEKDRFLDRFDSFVHRDWVGRNFRNTREEFRTFCEKHERCILKRRTDYGGHGAELADLSPETADALYDRMVAEDLIAEELVTQCDEMAALHPHSVNTVRVLTVGNKIFGATLRQGSGGSFVDNSSAGGFFSPVDVDTGIVAVSGVDKDARQVLINPTTNITIPGFQIPMWDQTRKMLTEAVKLIPDAVMVGWDVAYTPDGPILIEGNAYPGIFIHQGNYRGLARELKRAVNEATKK